jgi:chromosome segregation ATPase
MALWGRLDTMPSVDSGAEDKAHRAGQRERLRRIRDHLGRMEGHFREMENNLRSLDDHLRHEEQESERWHAEWDDPQKGA